MHAQDLIIIASGTGIALLLMGYYIRKLILRAFDRHYDAGVRDQKTEHGGRIALLNTDINALTQLRTREAQELDILRRQLLGIKATPFTSSDHRHLTEITQFLALALQTWKALKGTEASQVRAEQLIKISRAMAYRVFHTVETAGNLNALPLDTQLIEWLDKHGTFSACGPDMSLISFPHQADSKEHMHLRDALRDAFELDTQRQTIEPRQLSAEDAA